MLAHDPYVCSLVLWHFGRIRVKSDGTRLEVTLLEAPWRNGKTERGGKDWKEDNYKMTRDGPEAQTCTDSAEDCDDVNQARA